MSSHSFINSGHTNNFIKYSLFVVCNSCTKVHLEQRASLKGIFLSYGFGKFFFIKDPCIY